MNSNTKDQVIGATRRWLERAVIGLDLCPFAAGVHAAGRIRFAVSEQRSPAGLLDDIRAELLLLRAADPMRCETTLLIHPYALQDFIEFNEFLGDCERAIADLGVEGTVQIASFHPRYQFAGTRPEDIENYTNRSPYPTLHLLREASVERAIAARADPAGIYRRNIATMRALGHDGWRRLWESADGRGAPDLGEST